jgi:hypothetical protein
MHLTWPRRISVMTASEPFSLPRFCKTASFRGRGPHSMARLNILRSTSPTRSARTGVGFGPCLFSATDRPALPLSFSMGVVRGYVHDGSARNRRIAASVACTIALVIATSASLLERVLGERSAALHRSAFRPSRPLPTNPVDYAKPLWLIHHSQQPILQRSLQRLCL